MPAALTAPDPFFPALKTARASSENASSAGSKLTRSSGVEPAARGSWASSVSRQAVRRLRRRRRVPVPAHSAARRIRTLAGSTGTTTNPTLTVYALL